MKHTVTISIAPVLCILDDAAEPISLTAFPLSIAVRFPCWIYALLSALSWQAPRLLAGIRLEISDWRDDLRLIWRVWTGCKAWAVGTG